MNIYVLTYKQKTNRSISVLYPHVLWLLFAGLFTLICASVWGGCHQQYFDTREPENWAGNDIGQLSWAFGIAVTDAILTFISLCLLIASIAGGGEPMY